MISFTFNIDFRAEIDGPDRGMYTAGCTLFSASHYAMDSARDTCATITVRIVKSFEFKNYRALVFRDVDLGAMCVADLWSMVEARVLETPALAQYRPCLPTWDTLKIYYTRQGAKTSNPMINLPPRDADQEAVGRDAALFLPERDSVAGGRPLCELGVHDESEITCFSRSLYDAYCINPSLRWE
jgi:hypothetical protein